MASEAETWRPKGRTRPMLFDAFPAMERQVPWMPLAHVPTRIDSLDGLRDYFGRSGLWMKRDDLISPLYGGNKVRRYEHVLAHAIARGARRIVTAGGLASTQATATTLFGRALGLGVRIVLFDQPVTRFARTSLLANAHAGAELVYGGGYVRTAYRTARAMRQDRDNYLILPGAANALANLGYIDAMLELGEQVRRGEMPVPDVIMLPTGSSGTLAALALGCSYLGWKTEVLGVRITSSVACNRVLIEWIMRNTRNRIARADARAAAAMHDTNFRLHHGAIGRGYGYPTRESVDAIDVVKRMIGAEGEVTYSGKAVAALRAIGQHPSYRTKRILLWNTLSAVRPIAPESAIDLIPRDVRWVFETPTTA